MGLWTTNKGLHEKAKKMCYSDIIDKEVREIPSLFCLCEKLGSGIA